MNIRDGLAFDDVLLVPAYASFMPGSADVATKITRTIHLNTPILSAAMDTVTDHKMAIALAQLGGLGVIHRNMTIGHQAEEIRRVKRYQAKYIQNPISIIPDATVAEVVDLMTNYKISGIPVIDPTNDKVIGIISSRDVRYLDNYDQPVSEVMTKDNLVTAPKNITEDDAKKLFHQHKVEKLILVDEDGKCVGLITAQDLEKTKAHPLATVDDHGRLRVAASVGTGKYEFDRAAEMTDSGADLIVVDASHGDTKAIVDMVNRIRRQRSHDIQVMAGNVVTLEGAQALIDAGADAIKVGVGPGAASTTRQVAGVGVPQLTAIMDVAIGCRSMGIPVISDGGVRNSGDFAKALAAGSNAVMIGSLFAGTEESPGDASYGEGRAFKKYRGMGSHEAMRFSHQVLGDHNNDDKSRNIAIDGVEQTVPYRGPIKNVIRQLMNGLQTAMYYTGTQTIPDLHANANFIRITPAGMLEGTGRLGK